MSLHVTANLIIAAGCLILFSASIARGEDQPIDVKPTAIEEFSPGIIRTTWTYKKVGDLKIQANVYRPNDDKLRPVVIWVHGGALILGNRNKPGRRVREPLLEAGYIIVSIDYRLAPETKLPVILQDLEDAYTWVHRHGTKLFNGKTDRLILMGGSSQSRRPCLLPKRGVQASDRPGLQPPYRPIVPTILECKYQPSTAVHPRGRNGLDPRFRIRDQNVCARR
jgi:hypothetical protein